jgi:gamma-glutamyltranspeptidase / glutathione hydrolase
MDCSDNAIDITQSIELVYGAKVAARGFGFLYNNYLWSPTLDGREQFQK